MGLLTVWLGFSWRWLPDPNKLRLLSGSTVDDLPSRREHPIIHLVVLSHLIAWTSIAMHLVSRLLNFRVWGVFLNTTHTLSPCAEEALHTIQVNYTLHSLWTLLRFFLNWLILAIATTYIVIAKPVLLWILALRRLYLRFESVIDTLSLWQGMVHTLRTGYLVHRHIWTHGHALMHLPMTSRG